MARFLNTADWKIGRQYSQFSADDTLPIAEARLEAVQTIARLASEHAVDAVLVAGDVFDAQTVAERTIRKLFNAMQGFAGPWIMIPGNHDAALTESVWTQARVLSRYRLINVFGVETDASYSNGTDFSCQCIKLVGKRQLDAALPQELTFADHVQEFNASQDTFG